MNRKIKSLLRVVAYTPIGSYFISLLGGRGWFAELMVFLTKRKLLAQARKVFEEGSSLGTFDDYKKALEKHWVSYNEYAYQFQFYKKSEEERDEYISTLRMSDYYRRYTPISARAVFQKRNFLKAFKKHIHRKWLYVPDASYQDFEKLVTSYDCIVKPCNGKRGRGVFKIYKDADNNDNRKLYAYCVKEKMLVEQCVESCDELKTIHPHSLNTIRVVTIANKNKACVFSGVLRTGVGGSVVDNSHAGGISAQINVIDGIVETDGANTDGARFTNHPDSDIAFKGFKIPKWDVIVKTCCEEAKLLSNPITGWDVAINNQGEVEFIEAQYGPDMDVMQTRYQKGAKKKLYSLIKEYTGVVIQ